MLITVAVPGCCNGTGREKAVHPAASVPVPAKINRPFVVMPADSAFFRRNYHGPEKMNDRDAEIYCNRDPDLMGEISPWLHERLESAGFIRRDGLILKRFKWSEYGEISQGVINRLSLISKNGATAKALAKLSPGREQFIIRVSTTRATDSMVRVHYFGEQYAVTTADIVPGGFKEIVVLVNWYIANGDNYDMYIYEVME